MKPQHRECALLINNCSKALIFYITIQKAALYMQESFPHLALSLMSVYFLTFCIFGGGEGGGGDILIDIW